MPYRVIPTTLPDVLVLEPTIHRDDRGLFYESFNVREFERATGARCAFVQDNHSVSMRGVLRGLHYQIEHPQAKLVRVTDGEILDVVVDLRRRSPTFGQWTSVTLSRDNARQLWVPQGMAHGFLVKSERAEVLYKTTDYWYPEHERTLAWDDPGIGIEWRAELPPRLAAKDAAGVTLENAELFE